MQLPVQESLFGSESVIALRPVETAVRRYDLGAGAWVDFRPAWMAGADRLFEDLVNAVPWNAERRPMYDRLVDVPRLVSHYDEGAELPSLHLDAARRALVGYYQGACEERLTTVGMCLYRDGQDSVAWHGDRIGRDLDVETLVAIVSLGSTRRFLLRPRGGGASAYRFELASGDLLVMGGTCQRYWEHCVPKTLRHVGPRLSIQFRTVPRFVESERV